MITVDYVIYVCEGCKSRHKIYFDKPLVGEDGLLTFLNGDHPPCGCGAERCDIRVHMMGEKE